MKTRALFILGFIMTLGWLGVATADVVIVSPLLHFDPNRQDPLCMALNVSNRPVDVSLRILDSVGQPQGATLTEPALPPRHMADIGVSLVVVTDSFASCEVTSQAAKRGDILVTLCSTDIPNNRACVVAVTAE
jgi:hypothetical protein